MLETLTIKNFAIIENTSLSFDSGFNVLIGETGAGKSIILDALKFVLGDKPNKDDIRNGTTEMSVKATFSDINFSAKQKLDEFQIDYDDIVIIARTFTNEGKSICNINGETVTVGMLKQLGQLIMDMYGQHESYSLLNTKNHLKMIDSYKPEILKKEKQEISNLLKELKLIEDKISTVGGQGTDRERTIDLLSYQIKEIENANIKPNEDEDLEKEINTLSNYEKISTSLSAAYNALISNSSSHALSNLQNANMFDPSLTELTERLSSSLIEIEDITSCVSRYLSSMTYSQNDLDNLTERLEYIKTIKKKYGPTIDDALKYLDKIKNDLDEIINSEEILKKLIQQKSDIRKSLYKASTSLHNLRIKICKEIKTRLEDELKTLGMKNTKFEIVFEPVQDIDNCTFTHDGFDKVEFLFSANVGEKERSLSKTISGGEMSRFMLSLKNVFAEQDDVDLLIFDEIDSGVSGEIGYSVGQKLATLATKYQIICITHLPQVTALADKFIFIKKFVENNHTKSVATYLDETSLAEYLSSLFGSKQSEASITHAQELIQGAKEYKQLLNK